MVVNMLGLLVVASTFLGACALTIPSGAPSNAAAIDPAQLSVSLEFFAFPGYTQLVSTGACPGHITDLRGHAPAVRIGGTTQSVFIYNGRSMMCSICSILLETRYCMPFLETEQRMSRVKLPQ
jgi:hypothetical protein